MFGSNTLFKIKFIRFTLCIATFILLLRLIFNVFLFFLHNIAGMTVVISLSVSRQQVQHVFSRHDQAKNKIMICNFRQDFFEVITRTCPKRKAAATSNTVCTVVFVKGRIYSCNQSIYKRNIYYRRG
jgi:hypothetical protein